MYLRERQCSKHEGPGKSPTRLESDPSWTLGWPEVAFSLETSVCLNFSLYLFGNDLLRVQFGKTLFSFANLILIFNVYIFRSYHGGILEVPCLGTLVLLQASEKGREREREREEGVRFLNKRRARSNMSIEVDNNLSRPDHLGSVSRGTRGHRTIPSSFEFFHGAVNARSTIEIITLTLARARNRSIIINRLRILCVHDKSQWKS